MAHLVKTYIVYFFMLVALCVLFTFLFGVLVLLNMKFGWGVSFLTPLISGFDGMPESMEYVGLLGTVIASLVFASALTIFGFRKILSFTPPWIIALFAEAIVAIISAAKMASITEYTGYYSAGDALSAWWHAAAIAVPVAISLLYYYAVSVSRRAMDR